MRQRTWVIYIEEGNGHELANCITESEWYGLFNEEEAERTAAALNKIILECLPDDDERPQARAMPLEIISPAALMRKVRLQTGFEK